MNFHEELLPMRNERDKEIKQRSEFLEKRRFNQLSKDKRVIWMTYLDKETPCTKVGKYFNEFLNGTLEEYKAQYTQILTEANG